MPQLNEMTKIIEQMQANTGLTAEQLATALLAQYHLRRPLILADDPAPRKFEERNDRRAKRDDREKRSGAGRERRELGIEFDTYRIQVGRDHGARPQDIVRSEERRVGKER